MARQKTTIRTALTNAEINECLLEVFQSLPTEDQENIQTTIDELSKIPNMGPKSALDLIFVVEQQVFAVDEKKNLPRLNEILKGG